MNFKERSGKRLTVRYRLLAIALLPTLVVIPVLLGATMLRWNAKFDGILISKVRSDLTVAHQYFSRILESTGDDLTALGESVAFHAAVESGNTEELAGFLDTRRALLGLDFLYAASAEGDVISAAGGRAPSHAGLEWPVVASAAAGKPSVAVDIFPKEALADISASLAERASLELIPTANAVPSADDYSTQGMVVHAASPVTLGTGGRLLLVGGILLNRNLEFIDTINDLVYQPGSLPQGSQGTATLFLDDVRISTNVRLFEGKRALGTRVSAVVRNSVLGQGHVWLDRAFVVNDWYISAYEPISDSFGERVGMLYVGFLETPFRQTKIITLLMVVLTFVAVAAASVPLFMRWAGAIFRPLERMTETINKVEAGDLDARSGMPDRGDEISHVASHLDSLLDGIQRRDQQLRSWNEELNTRVEERTFELREANRQLESTTKQLVMSEKLAAIGEITAGVAHEINNPIAVIQGNLEVLREIVGERAEDARTEFRLIDEQTERMRQIVTKLLLFARPDEFSGGEDTSDTNEVIRDCLPLVRHLIRKQQISVHEELYADGLAAISRTALQQVLVNLIVNAIHAMPEGGDLVLSSQDEVRDGRSGIAVKVEDTGSGIEAEVAARIFDPFFTTKKGTGTGLGLSISHMLVSEAGGAIAVQSEPGKGTVFTIWLPEFAAPAE